MIKHSTKRGLFSLALILFIAGVMPAGGAGVDPDGFAGRMRIRFDGYTAAETLTDFPALVRLGPLQGMDYDGFASPTGADLRFADASGTNALVHEIEQWNPNGTSAVWVRMPQLTNATEIWAYWGSPVAATSALPGQATEVWDSGFKSVWHFSESAGAVQDSTVNDVDSTVVSGVNQGVAGRAGGGDLFDGTDDYMYFDHGSTLNLPGTLTYEALVRWDGGGDNYSRVIANTPSGNYQDIHVNGAAADGLFRTRYYVAGVNTVLAPGYTLTAGDWCHLAVVWDGTARRMYANGVLVGSDAQGPGDSGDGWLYVGANNGNGANNFGGAIDEIRISDRGRSSNWVAATHQTMNDDNFATYELMITAAPPSGIAASSATMNGAVGLADGLPTTVTLFYGSSDAGASAAGWGVTNLLGEQSGSFSTNVTGLAQTTAYYYRFYASNTANQAWSGVQAFSTPIEGVTGMTLWLAADTIGAGDGDDVAVWHDLTGSGNRAAQGDPELQGGFETGALGGKPAVHFGSGETLDLASSVTAQGSTVFIVQRQDPTQGLVTHPLGGNLRMTGADQSWHLQNDGGNFGITSGHPSTRWSLNVLQLLAGDYRLWVNGDEAGAGTATQTLSPFDGVGVDLDGSIAEVIVIDHKLTPGEHNTLGTYLSTKYDLSTAYENRTLDAGQFLYKAPISYAYDKGDTLTDFPLYVRLDSSVAGFDADQFASPYGYDLRFTDDTQTNLLNFEVEQWLWAAPVAYYRFENSLLDTAAAGHGHHATVRGAGGGFSTDTPSGSGFALDLGNTNGPYAEVLAWKGIGNRQARSVTVWIKTTATNAAIVSWGENVAGQKWGFRVQDTNGTNGAIRVEINGGYVVGSTPVNDGNWHFVAFVLPEGGAQVLDVDLFVDGRLERKSAVNPQALNTDAIAGSNVNIGNDHSNYRLLGLMDELAIWDAALTADQIAAVYNGGVPVDVASGLADGDTIHAWVQVPAFTNNTRVWAHWGNPSEPGKSIFGAHGMAWNNDYETVWHLNGSGPDSTVNNLDGGANEGDPVRTNGIAFDGTLFDEGDGVQDRITYTPPMTVYNQYTIGVWAKALIAPDHANRSVFNSGTANPDFQFDFTAANATANYRLNADNGGSAHHFGPLALGEWVHLVMTCDGTTTRLYYNGRQSDAFDLVNNEFNRIQVGCNRNQDRHFDGVADEMHFMTVPASSNWVWATYSMLAPAGTFVTYGDAVGPAPVIANDPATRVADTSATLNATLAVTSDTPTAVYAVWGQTDGGGAWGAWDNTNRIGTAETSGPVAYAATGLTSQATYHYALFASNAFGTAWAQPSRSFTTLAPGYHTVTPGAGPGGSILPVAAEYLNAGGPSALYTFIADTGYHLTNVVADGTNQGVLANYQFSNVQASHTVQALFGINMYTVTVAQATGGTILPDPAGTVAHGSDSLAFTLVPDAGYYLADTKVDGVSLGPVSSYRLEDVQDNHTLTAVFAAFADVFPTNGLTLWLDAGRIPGGVHGEPVAAWQDLSGNGYDVEQLSVAAQPTYRAAAVGGEPALRFDATVDHLQRGDALGLVGDPAMTVFVVANGPDEDENRFLQIGKGANSDDRTLSFGTEAAIRYNGGNNIWANDRITGAFAVGAFTRNALDTYRSPLFYKNGVLATSSGGSADDSLLGLEDERTWIGAGWAGNGNLNHTLEGDLAEVIVYDRVLDYVERNAVGHYLEQKYGIDTTYVDPNSADVGVTIATDAYRPVSGGGAFVYTLAVTNRGPAVATGVVVTNTFPAGVNYVSDSSGGDYGAATHLWTVGSLGYQGGTTLVVNCTLAAGTGDQSFTNKATVTLIELDEILSDNSDTVVFASNYENMDADDFLRRMNITFPGYTKAERLANFPVLVKLEERLDGFHYGDFASASGDDLRFAAADGTTTLAYEIEKWDPSGTSLVWVQVREFSAGTHIWVYWGNAGEATAPAYTTNGATWSSGFEAVYHLAESGGAALDSTANDFHGVANNGVVRGQNAAVGPGYTFDGVDDHVVCATNIFTSTPSRFTVEWWLNPKTHTSWNQKLGTATGEWGLWLFHTDVSGQASAGTFNNAASRINAPGGLTPLNTWKHFAYTFDNGLAHLYKDGVAVGVATNSAAPGGPWNGFWIGRPNAQTIDGAADEVRISNVGWSSNWIWACSMNQAQGTHDAFSDYEPAVGPPNVRNTGVSTIRRTQAELQGELVSTGGAPASVWLYWGTNDAGEAGDAWGNTNAFGQRVPGLLSANLTMLSPDTTYFCRFYATNAFGDTWAAPAVTFETAATNEFVIEALAGDNGSIVPAGVQYVTNGTDSPLFSFPADTGYHLEDLLVDGSSVGTPASHQFTNVATDHTIRATFAINMYQVTVVQDANGTISPDPAALVPYGGDSELFRIDADPGYYVTDTRVNGQSIGPAVSYQFHGLTNHATITASYAAGPETPVTADLVLWLEAGILDATHGQDIQQWQDLSGQDHHVAQDVPANAPSFVTNVVNGRPGVFFDPATDEYLSRDDALGFGADPAMSVVAVVTGPAGTTHRYLHLGDSAGAGGRVIAYCTDAAVRYNDGNRIFANDSQSGPFSIGVWTRNAGDQHNQPLYWKDGKLGVQTTADNTPPNLVGLEDEETLVGLGRATSGAFNDFLNGTLVELMVFSRAITTEEQRQIGRHLAAKYGIETGYPVHGLPAGADDPILWLDASAIQTVASGADLAVWKDLSGFGRDVLQGNAPNRPMFSASVFSGRPAVVFDTDDYLGRDDALGLSGSPALSVVAMVRGPVPSSDRRLFQLGDAQGSNGMVMAFCTDAAVRYNDGAVEFLNDGLAGRDALGVFTRGVGSTYGALRFYHGGRVATATGSINPTNAVQLVDESTVVGAGKDGGSDVSHYLAGTIAELIVYGRALDDTQRKAVEVYLTDKYGIGGTVIMVR